VIPRLYLTHERMYWGTIIIREHKKIPENTWSQAKAFLKEEGRGTVYDPSWSAAWKENVGEATPARRRYLRSIKGKRGKRVRLSPTSQKGNHADIRPYRGESSHLL